MNPWASLLTRPGASTCIYGPELPIEQVRALLKDAGPVRELDWRRPPSAAEAVRAARELTDATASGAVTLLLIGCDVADERQVALHEWLRQANRGALVAVTPDGAPNGLLLKPFERTAPARAFRGA